MGRVSIKITTALLVINLMYQFEYVDTSYMKIFKTFAIDFQTTMLQNLAR